MKLFTLQSNGLISVKNVHLFTPAATVFLKKKIFEVNWKNRSMGTETILTTNKADCEHLVRCADEEKCKFWIKEASSIPIVGAYTCMHR